MPGKSRYTAPVNAQPELTQNHRVSTTATVIPSSAIHVLLVYEDLATGNRVMRIMDSLSHRLGKAVVVRSDMWKFDVLNCASMGRIAAGDAQEADVIVVSAHGAEVLSDEIRSWFQRSLSNRRKRSGALVALLAHTEEEPGRTDQTMAFLEELAKRSHMDFSAVVTGEEETDLPTRRVADDLEEPPPSLEEFFRRFVHPRTGL